VPLLSHQRLPRPRHVVVATFQFFSDRLLPTGSITQGGHDC